MNLNKLRCQLTFAGNSVLLPSDVIDIALLLGSLRDFWRETILL